MSIATLAALVLAAAVSAGAAVPPADEVSITATTASDGTQVLVHETEVAAPVTQVWEAISTARGWTTWAVPVAWLEGDLIETSYTPGAAPGDPSTIQQQILAREPGRRLVFRTIKAPEGFPHFDAYRQVVVTIELETLGETATRVRLTSTGYPDSEAGRTLAGFFRDGNRSTLEQLRQRFVSGPIDWSTALGD
ncbi:MAG TPA: SRPBCC domain-containing protein [Croceibacterium sp.]